MLYLVMKPQLTQQEIDKFHEEFSKIVALAPEHIQKRWNENDKISWLAHDTFIIESNVHVDFEPKLKDKVVSLLNKMKNRTL
jgi:hypothetical protein